MNPRRIYFTFIIFVGSLCIINAQKYNSIADDNAIIKEGNARFTILTSRVIRMEWSETGKFEDKASLTFVNRKLSVPAHQIIKEVDLLIIKTDALTLTYRNSENKFSSENLKISFSTGGMIKNWVFGEENKGNLLGTTRTLDSYDGDLNTKDSTHLKLEDGILSRDGWVLINDTDRPLFDDSDFKWVQPREKTNYQDFYFFAYGYDYKSALKDFTEIAGKIPLPPKFVFGYWFSRWRPFSEKELRELVDTHNELSIPLDVLVIDMDWHITNMPYFFQEGKRIKDPAGQDYGWTGFTWNKDYFPEPKSFLDWTEKKGLKTCLNLHPASGIQPHEEQFVRMANAMGIDPASKKYVPFDIVNKKFAQNYFNLVLHPMENDGVDFWWLDWQQWNTTNIDGVNPTFYLNYVHFTDMVRQNKIRPLIYHRWGGIGNHRYQIGFSGDTKISWNSLAFQPYFTSTAANVGFGYWGNDIGGFFGEPNTPENFLRWFQFGVYSPILKTHATGRNYSILRKVWEYPSEIFLELKNLIDLRYSLLPYIYSEARKTYDSGISICRPLYYEFPKEEESYKYANEYFFGENIIVHPITRPAGFDSLFLIHKTWLPSGQWYEESSGKVIDGDTLHHGYFAMREIPVYLKAGAIVTTQSKVLNTNKIPERIIINIYPGASGNYSLYDDEGNSSNYQTKNHSFTDISFTKSESKEIIRINPVRGKYKGMPIKRTFEIILHHTFPPEKVELDKKTIGYNNNLIAKSWNYDGQSFATHILLPEMDAKKKKVIEVSGLERNLNQLNGLKAKMNRLYDFSKFLADKRNYRVQTIWNDAKYSSDLVMHAAQTGLRVTQNPSTIDKELIEFDRNYKTILDMLERLSAENKIYKPYYDLLKVTD